MKNKLTIILGLVLLLSIALIALLPSPMQKRLHAPERKQWKRQAIERITLGSRDQRMISNEVTLLQAEAVNHSGDGWISTNVLLMTNGEHLVYSHIDAKQDHRIHDLFLARGSDGKWYYSTFHFCIDMITLRAEIEGQPKHGSIAEFAQTYAAKEFDGQSDECLKKTWPVKK